MLAAKFQQLEDIEMVPSMVTLEEFQSLKLLPAETLDFRISQLQKNIDESIKQQKRLQQLG
jgi:hypothetical protein